MYKIIRTDSNKVIECLDVKEVKKYVQNIGADGALLKWLVGSKKAVIIYYTEIIAYVTYYEIEDTPRIEDTILRDILEDMLFDDLVELLIEYDQYVEKALGSSGSPKGLLYYLAVIKD